MHLRYACVKIPPEDLVDENAFDAKDIDSFGTSIHFLQSQLSHFLYSIGWIRFQNIRFPQTSYGAIYGSSEILLQEIQE